MRTVVAAVVLLTAAACFRVDTHDLQLHVPGMLTDRDMVLVTNAAQRELIGEMSDVRHECKVDLQRSLLVYYEGPRVLDGQYQMRLLAALRQAGYAGSVISAAHNPTPPMLAANYPHPIVLWPDRCRLVIRIPALKGNLDANRVTDAIAYGRTGGRPDNLVVDPAHRTVTIKRQNRLLATFCNYAHAIATAGYAVDGWDKLDADKEPPARGWLPFEG